MIVDYRNKVIPVAEFAAAGGGHARKDCFARVIPIQEGAVEQRRSGAQDRYDPAVSHKISGRVQVEPVAVFVKTRLFRERKIGVKQLI